MRELLFRLFDWFRRDRLDAELAEELRFHRERLERDFRGAQHDEDEARWAAHRQLGNVTRLTEEARERWSLPWLDTLQQDVRYAFRGMRRSPGFALTVVLTLALGIGANAAIFGVIDRLMFRPYPYLRDPGSVDRVYMEIGDEPRSAFTLFPYTRYLDLKRGTTSFSSYAAFVTATHGVGTGDAARERAVLAVSASFFDFFDASPTVGRFFLPAEDTIPVGADVAVLGHDYWTTELAGRGDVVGESIQVGNARYTIVGVAPRGFIGVTEESAPAVFVPITAYAPNEAAWARNDYFRTYNWDWIQMMVRRKPGVTRATATADLTSAAIVSWNAARVVHPRYGSVEDVRPVGIAGALKTSAGPDPGLEARTLRWVTGVAAIVLLIASANVANLLLARAMRRRREFALRIAIGAGRGRLAAQAFTETIVLSLLGCAVGIAVAQWGGFAIRRLFLAESSGFDVVADWRTVTVAIAAALVAAMLTGIAPVLYARSDDLTSSLKSGAREGMYQRSRARAMLLVTQAALSVVLLVGAGLFVRSLQKVRDLRLGYDVNPVLLARWEQRGTQMDSSAQVALRARLLAAALARPDVEHGAWVNNVVFGRGTSTLNMAVPGVDTARQNGRFTFSIVSSDYFATVDTRLLRGRTFSTADRARTQQVAVVSAAMANRLWPGEAALGRCIQLSWRDLRPDTMPCTSVIGVVENAVHDPIADFPMRYYLTEAQVDFGSTWLLLRMRRDPAVAGEDVRRALQAVMPGQAIVTVRPARELFDAKRRSWLVGATLFVGLGMLALIVAAVGLYGVISYNVAQRRHELGVRVALGAQTWDVVRLVLAQAMRFAIVGVAVGATLAFVAGRWLQPLLFQQSARDPLVFLAVALMLLVVTLIASGVPALRATRANPNTVLRSD